VIVLLLDVLYVSYYLSIILSVNGSGVPYRQSTHNASSGMFAGMRFPQRLHLVVVFNFFRLVFIAVRYHLPRYTKLDDFVFELMRFYVFPIASVSILFHNFSVVHAKGDEDANF
jgi:hypothetical protein